MHVTLKKPFLFCNKIVQLFKRGLKRYFKRRKMFSQNLIAIINLSLPFATVIKLLVKQNLSAPGTGKIILFWQFWYPSKMYRVTVAPWYVIRLRIWQSEFRSRQRRKDYQYLSSLSGKVLYCCYGPIICVNIANWMVVARIFHSPCKMV